MAYIQPQDLNPKQKGIEVTDKVMVTDTNNLTKIVSGASIVEMSGTCADAAGVTLKTINLVAYTDTTLPDYVKIHCDFTNGNTVGDASTTSPQFKIKNANNAFIVDASGNEIVFNLCDSRGHLAGTGCYNSGDTMTLKRIGNKLLIENSDVRKYENGITTRSDGTTVYNTQSVDSNLNSALANYQKITKITGDINLDSYVNEGIYEHNGTGTLTNAPTTSNSGGFSLQVTNGNTNCTFQELCWYTSSAVKYIRSRYYGNNAWRWTEWHKVITDSDLGTIKALKLNAQWSTFAEFISDIPSNFSGFRTDAVVQQNVVDNDSPSPTKNYYWWNVMTFGTFGRLTQIAVNSYVGYPTSAHVYVRAKHDSAWSSWREL